MPLPPVGSLLFTQTPGTEKLLEVALGGKRGFAVLKTKPLIFVARSLGISCCHSHRELPGEGGQCELPCIEHQVHQALIQVLDCGGHVQGNSPPPSLGLHHEKESIQGGPRLKFVSKNYPMP